MQLRAELQEMRQTLEEAHASAQSHMDSIVTNKDREIETLNSSLSLVSALLYSFILKLYVMYSCPHVIIDMSFITVNC